MVARSSSSILTELRGFKPVKNFAFWGLVYLLFGYSALQLGLGLYETREVSRGNLGVINALR